MMKASLPTDMTWLAIVLGCVLSVELILWSGLFAKITAMLSTIKKVTAVMSSNQISDHWKERAVPAYSVRLMQSSLLILVIFLAVIAIFALLSLGAPGIVGLLMTPLGIVASIVISLAYFKVRTRG